MYCTKFIEHIAHQYGYADAGQGELQDVLLLHLGTVGLQRAAHTEKALAGGQKKIVHAGGERLLKRPVGEHAKLEVGAVAAHHIHFGGREFVSVLLVDPPLDVLQHFGIGELEEFVPATSAGGAVGTEKSPVVEAFKGDAKVVGGRVHGYGQVVYFPLVGHGVLRGAVEVEPSEARCAPSAGEVEFAAGTEGWEALVAGGIDRRTEIFQTTEAVTAAHLDAPQVKPSKAAGHIGGKIQPAAIGRRCRMGVGGKRVGGDGKLGGFAPLGIGARRSPYFGQAGVLRVGTANGEIHGGAVGREGAGSLVVLGVQLSFRYLGRFPFSFFIFLGEEDVAVLHGGDTADISQGLLSGGGEIKLCSLGAHIDGPVIGTVRVEKRGGLDGVSGTLTAEGILRVAVLQGGARGGIVGEAFKIGGQGFLRAFVIALLLQLLAQQAEGERVGVLIPLGIAQRADSPGGVAVAGISIAHFEGNASAQLLLLGRSARIGLLVLPGCLGILTDGHGGIAPTDGFVDTATGLAP